MLTHINSNELFICRNKSTCTHIHTCAFYCYYTFTAYIYIDIDLDTAICPPTQYTHKYRFLPPTHFVSRTTTNYSLILQLKWWWRTNKFVLPPEIWKSKDIQMYTITYWTALDTVCSRWWDACVHAWEKNERKHWKLFKQIHLHVHNLCIYTK